MAEQGELKAWTEGAVGLVRLARPERRNALGRGLLSSLIAALERFAADEVRCVILGAEITGGVWSAGHDVSELPSGPGCDPLDYSVPMEEALRAIEAVPAPVIAVVDGTVWGGACDLVMTCDIAIGTPECAFAMTASKLGVAYSTTGLLHFVSRLGHNLAREMFFTAEPIDAERAMAIGILNRLLPTAQAHAEARRMAETIASRAPLSIAALKEQFGILSAARPLTATAFERLQALRRRVFDSDDYREGLAAFREKRPPAFKGR